jgi:hypothetical protein
MISAVVFLQGCGGERSYPFGTLPCSSSSASTNSGNNSSGCYVSVSSASVSSSSSSSSTSSSSNSSSSVPTAAPAPLPALIEAIPNASGINPDKSINYAGKILQVITTEAEFNALTSAYINHNIDFNLTKLAEGQVVLVDDGPLDNCANQQINSDQISAEDISDTTLKIIVTRKAVVKTSSCSSPKIRPFQFFYVNSKKLLIFDERTSP